MNKNRRAYRVKMQKARVEFLKAHPELWDKDKKFVVGEMKKAGVVSQKTYFADVRVEKTVEELKHAKVPSNG